MELGRGGAAARSASFSSDHAGAAEAAAAGEDRLSTLPDDVLVLILLRLSTRAAARTSVLSHRWRCIWALLPVLRFTAPPEPHWLRDVLDAHEVLVRSLLVRADGASPEFLAVWLPAAARRVTGDLTLHSHALMEDVAEDLEQAFELPCFEKATSISFVLAFQGLAVPPTGVFTRLKDLHLSHVWLHGPGELGDAVSSLRCPCLQRLMLENARGLGDLSIHSESLLVIVLRNLRSLSQLTVVAPALKELAVGLCFLKSRANISAPQLVNLDWTDKYDPSSVHFGKMEHLQCLGTSFYLVYPRDVIRNHSCLSLLQRFEGIKTLFPEAGVST